MTHAGGHKLNEKGPFRKGLRLRFICVSVHNAAFLKCCVLVTYGAPGGEWGLRGSTSCCVAKRSLQQGIQGYNLDLLLGLRTEFAKNL